VRSLLTRSAWRRTNPTIPMAINRDCEVGFCSCCCGFNRRWIDSARLRRHHPLTSFGSFASLKLRQGPPRGGLPPYSPAGGMHYLEPTPRASQHRAAGRVRSLLTRSASRRTNPTQVGFRSCCHGFNRRWIESARLRRYSSPTSFGSFASQQLLQSLPRGGLPPCSPASGKHYLKPTSMLLGRLEALPLNEHPPSL
jgi:hypothetical protein